MKENPVTYLIYKIHRPHVCVFVCLFVCSRAQAAQVSDMISFWYQRVRHHLGSVLKKVSERFDHICARGGRKRVEKHGFFGHFSPISSQICFQMVPIWFLWYVLVMSRLLLLWRVFCKGFQVDSYPFWVISWQNLPKMAENGRKYFSSNSLQITF